SQGFSDVPTDARSVVLILVVGIVHTGLAYALYFGSMNGLSTQTVAIFSYVDPVTALLLSIFLLHEEFSMLGIIGAVLMIGSAIVSVTGRQKQ
ncbi:MAG: EamA family transporter, partial [Ruminococcus sp.]|nr:EamA family transporter [Ruminococcus sp.]